MKKMINSGILFLFLIAFLLMDNFAKLKIEEDKESTNIYYECKSLEEEFEALSSLKEINVPNVTVNYSKVILREPFNFFNQMTILKGEKENITTSSAVIKNNNLIGIVTSITDHTSKVRLLSSKDTSISVKVLESYGVLTTNELKENWINNLTKETNVKKGDPVYTSGLTEVPGNILIGSVEEIEKDSLGLVNRIKVKLSEDLNQVNYVTILTKEQIS